MHRLEKAEGSVGTGERNIRRYSMRAATRESEERRLSRVRVGEEDEASLLRARKGKPTYYGKDLHSARPMVYIQRALFNSHPHWLS